MTTPLSPDAPTATAAAAVAGAALVCAAALTAWRLRLLTPWGALGAGVLGAVILFCGGFGWALTTAAMFFATAAWSRAFEGRRSKTGSAEPRTLRQVLANGVVLAFLALLHTVGWYDAAITAAWLGGLAAVAGDTWASGAPLIDRRNPRLLTTGRRVPPGTPGAVTAAGVALTALSGLVAALLHGVSSLFRGGPLATPPVDLGLVAAALAGGSAGGLFDSYLGASRQGIYRGADGQLTDRPAEQGGTVNAYVRGWRWLDNDLVNFGNSIVGALAAMLIRFVADWAD